MQLHPSAEPSPTRYELLLYLKETSLKLEHYIRTTCLYDLYPIAPYFYIVKLGFTGEYIFFLFLL